MTRTRPEKLDLLQGTLDMMVLRTLSTGPANGYEIARAIERLSEDVLAVDHGSLYPAAPLGEERPDCGKMGDVVHQPSRPLLPSHTRRAQAARGRTVQVGANGRCDHPRHATSLTVSLIEPAQAGNSQPDGARLVPKERSIGRSALLTPATRSAAV